MIVGTSAINRLIPLQANATPAQPSAAPPTQRAPRPPCGGAARRWALSNLAAGFATQSRAPAACAPVGRPATKRIAQSPARGSATPPPSWRLVRGDQRARRRKRAVPSQQATLTGLMHKAHDPSVIATGWRRLQKADPIVVNRPRPGRRCSAASRILVLRDGL